MIWFFICRSLTQINLKRDLQIKNPSQFCEGFSFICDLDRIQTCNLLSRNQMRYSVAPRGHCYSGCKYISFLENRKTSIEKSDSHFFPEGLQDAFGFIHVFLVDEELHLGGGASVEAGAQAGLEVVLDHRRDLMIVEVELQSLDLNQGPGE